MFKYVWEALHSIVIAAITLFSLSYSLLTVLSIASSACSQTSTASEHFAWRQRATGFTVFETFHHSILDSAANSNTNCFRLVQLLYQQFATHYFNSCLWPCGRGKTDGA